MEDDFSAFSPSLTSPATTAETIVPSDSDKLGYATRALYVGIGGDVSVEMLSGDLVLLRNMQPGVLYPLRVAQIRASGTTAADLVGLR